MMMDVVDDNDCNSEGRKEAREEDLLISIVRIHIPLPHQPPPPITASLFFSLARTT